MTGHTPLPPFAAYEAELMQRIGDPEAGRMVGLVGLAVMIVEWGVNDAVTDEERAVAVEEFDYECEVAQRIVRKWISQARCFSGDKRLEHVQAHQAVCKRLAAEVERALSNRSNDQATWSGLVSEYMDLMGQTSLFIQANAEDLRVAKEGREKPNGKGRGEKEKQTIAGLSASRKLAHQSFRYALATNRELVRAGQGSAYQWLADRENRQDDKHPYHGVKMPKEKTWKRYLRDACAFFNTDTDRVRDEVDKEWCYAEKRGRSVVDVNEIVYRSSQQAD